jgi:site-specific recombinase XerD
MIEDMAARNLGHHSQRSHIHSCRRFAAFLKRSPDTATADDVRRFQLHLVEAGLSVCNRNRIMTGVKFLFRVTLRRHDLAAEIYHLKEEPQGWRHALPRLWLWASRRRDCPAQRW